MTEKQHQIVIGTLLGDSWIQDGMLRLKQCARHKEYVFWLYQQLEDISSKFPRQREDNGQWYFQTRKLPEVETYERLFYRNGKKIVPKTIDEFLISPLSLAIWYMDDGTLDWRIKDHYAFRLTTNCFSMIENEKLIKVLKENFSVKANLQTTLIRGKRYPLIYIGKEGRDRFFRLVRPFILNCFSHKLPPNIRTPQRLLSVKKEMAVKH